MPLSEQDIEEFLLHYKTVISITTGQVPDGFQEWVESRDAMFSRWQDIETDERLKENPIYDVLPDAVHGRFVFLKKYKSHYAMQHMESEKFYAVQALQTPLDEMLPEYSVVEACLLPFKGVIVCDGLLRGGDVILGNNMMKAIRESYWKAKRSNALIEQISPNCEANPTEDDPIDKAIPPISARLDHPISRARLKSLRSCKKEELVILLNELADEHTIVHDRVDLYLKRGNSKELASELRGAIDRLENTGGYIDYYASDGVASQLHDILSSIERELIPSDPATALDVLHYFISTDEDIVGNADDSNGSIGDAYHRACELLGKASTAAGKPKHAEEIFLDLHEDTGYGTRDCLFDEAPNILNEVALARILEQWRERAKHEDPMAYGGIRIRIAQIAESIGDPELHDEASLCGRPIDEFPLVAIDVARVYLACGKPEIALTKLPSEKAASRFRERSELLLKIQQALGNNQAVADEFLNRFKTHGEAEDASNYLKNIPESKRTSISEELHGIIRRGNFTTLTKARYFAEMKLLKEAANIIQDNPDGLKGEYYSNVLDLADSLGEDFPLALTILYRTNLEPILDKAVSKIYYHAVSYARKLDKLARKISDWKDVLPHETYWLGIQEKHKRKSSFWKQYQRIAES